jgi:hypothetical protein
MFGVFVGIRPLLASICACGGMLLGCSSDDPPAEPQCLAVPGPLDCNGSYGFDPATDSLQPTFEDAYRFTFKPRCASPGCHSGGSPAGGLQLQSENEAFDSLHANGSNGIPRVTGGDISCGMVIVRIETHGEEWSMPRGTSLSEPDLCSVRHWINNGAER